MRSDLLKKLEAAALEYGRTWAAYGEAWTRNNEAGRPPNAEMHPETLAACHASIAAKDVLTEAALALHAHDAQPEVVVPAYARFSVDAPAVQTDAAVAEQG